MSWIIQTELIFIIHHADSVHIESPECEMCEVDPRDFISRLNAGLIPQRQWLMADKKLMLVIPERWGIPDTWINMTTTRLPAISKEEEENPLTIGTLIWRELRRRRKCRDM